MYVGAVTRVLADWRFWVALAGTVVAFAVAAIVSGTVDRSWRAETTIIELDEPRVVYRDKLAAPQRSIG